MGLENHVLLAPDSQEQGSFCIFVFVYPVMLIHIALSKAKPRLQWPKQKEVCVST